MLVVSNNLFITYPIYILIEIISKSYLMMFCSIDSGYLSDTPRLNKPVANHHYFSNYTTYTLYKVNHIITVRNCLQKVSYLILAILSQYKQEGRDTFGNCEVQT